MKAKFTLKISILALFMAITSTLTKAQDTIVSIQEPELTPMDTLTNNVKSLNDQMSILKKIKFSGYMQGQFQYIDSIGQKTVNGGNFDAFSDKRFMLRRARLKATYQGNSSEYVFQIDATEKGFAIKDMYLKYNLPYLKNVVSLTFGNQNRPFGYEIGYSSSQRESPERGRMSQTLFNGERDMGAMLTIQAPKNHPLNIFKLEAGLFNGTGGVDFDKKKDFISHLTFKKTLFNENLNIGAGLSYYDGSWRQGSKYQWEMGDVNGISGFLCDSTDNNVGNYSNNKRQYIGGDFQLDYVWFAGLTSVRAEYIQGQQPSVSGSSNPTTAPSTTSNTYLRNFNGAYFYFVQNIAQTKHQVCVKYDWYDPNTEVAGKDIIAKSGTKSTKLSDADVKYTTLGLGYAYKATENVKITFFYEMVENESTAYTKYTGDLKDNIFTCRVQYKF